MADEEHEREELMGRNMQFLIFFNYEVFTKMIRMSGRVNLFFKSLTWHNKFVKLILIFFLTKKKKKLILIFLVFSNNFCNFFN